MKTIIRYGAILISALLSLLIAAPATAAVCVENHNSAAIVKVIYGGLDKTMVIDQTDIFPFVNGGSMEVQGLPTGNTVYVNPKDKDMIEITGTTEFNVKATAHSNVCSGMAAPAAPAKAPAGR